MNNNKIMDKILIDLCFKIMTLFKIKRIFGEEYYYSKFCR